LIENNAYYNPNNAYLFKLHSEVLPSRSFSLNNSLLSYRVCSPLVAIHYFDLSKRNELKIFKYHKKNDNTTNIFLRENNTTNMSKKKYFYFICYHTFFMEQQPQISCRVKNKIIKIIHITRVKILFIFYCLHSINGENPGSQY